MQALRLRSPDQFASNALLSFLCVDQSYTELFDACVKSGKLAGMMTSGFDIELLDMRIL